MIVIARSMGAGRNDPCPCGSVRKYKRCCLPGDEEAARARRQAGGQAGGEEAAARRERLAGGLRELQRTIGEGDPTQAMEEMEERMRLLQGLLRAGGPLAAVRFDRARFAGVIESIFVPGKPRPRGLEAFARTVIPRVADPATIERLARELSDAAASGTLDEAGRRAALFGALTIKSAGGRRGMRPEASPGLYAVLVAQIEEWLHEKRKTQALVEGLAEDFRAGRIDSDQILEAVRQRYEQAGHSLTDPAMLEAANEQAEISLRRTLDALRGRRPPSLLALDEMVRLMAHAAPALRALCSAPLRSSGAEQALEQLVDALERGCGETMQRQTADRLFRLSLDKGWSKRDRRAAGDASVALQLEPRLVLTLAFVRTLGRPLLRNEEEGEHAHRLFGLAVWKAANLEPYAEMLEQAGETTAVANVRHAISVLPPEGLRTQIAPEPQAGRAPEGVESQPR